MCQLTPIVGLLVVGALLLGRAAGQSDHYAQWNSGDSDDGMGLADSLPRQGDGPDLESDQEMRSRQELIRRLDAKLNRNANDLPCWLVALVRLSGGRRRDIPPDEFPRRCCSFDVTGEVASCNNSSRFGYDPSPDATERPIGVADAPDLQIRPIGLADPQKMPCFMVAVTWFPFLWQKLPERKFPFDCCRWDLVRHVKACWDPNWPFPPGEGGGSGGEGGGGEPPGLPWPEPPPPAGAGSVGPPMKSLPMGARVDPKTLPCPVVALSYFKTNLWRELSRREFPFDCCGLDLNRQVTACWQRDTWPWPQAGDSEPHSDDSQEQTSPTLPDGLSLAGLSDPMKMPCPVVAVTYFRYLWQALPESKFPFHCCGWDLEDEVEACSRRNTWLWAPRPSWKRPAATQQPARRVYDRYLQVEVDTRLLQTSRNYDGDKLSTEERRRINKLEDLREDLANPKINGSAKFLSFLTEDDYLECFDKLLSGNIYYEPPAKFPVHCCFIDLFAIVEFCNRQVHVIGTSTSASPSPPSPPPSMRLKVESGKSTSRPKGASTKPPKRPLPSKRPSARPTKATEKPRKPTKATEKPRKPTKASKKPPKPTKTSGSPPTLGPTAKPAHHKKTTKNPGSKKQKI